MKIYISFDIEGVSGVADRTDIDESSPAFARTMQNSTEDVNAAIEGALAAGATKVVVNDGHGWGRRNLVYENLHPQAQLLRARITTPGLNMTTVDGSYDAVFFIGWHSRSARVPGGLSHCLSSKAFVEWRVNGTPVGEPELAAALAGYYGVPLALFSGDDRACAEVRQWAPDCELVVTKTAIDRQTALCLSKEVTHERLRRGAEQALRRKDSIRPFTFETPVVIEVDCATDHVAGAVAEIPTVTWDGANTIAIRCDDYAQAFKAAHAIQLIGNMAAPF